VRHHNTNMFMRSRYRTRCFGLFRAVEAPESHLRLNVCTALKAATLSCCLRLLSLAYLLAYHAELLRYMQGVLYYPWAKGLVGVIVKESSGLHSYSKDFLNEYRGRRDLWQPPHGPLIRRTKW